MLTIVDLRAKINQPQRKERFLIESYIILKNNEDKSKKSGLRIGSRQDLPEKKKADEAKLDVENPHQDPVSFSAASSQILLPQDRYGEAGQKRALPRADESLLLQ